LDFDPTNSTDLSILVRRAYSAALPKIQILAVHRSPRLAA